MKKLAIILLSMILVAGCSNQKLIDCNVERQELRIENDVLSQKVVDTANEAAVQKAELSQKIKKAETQLASQKTAMADLQKIVDQQLPELKKAYDKIKEQLETANEAVRQELHKNVENKNMIKQLEKQVEELKNTIESKEKLLKEANDKLATLTEALKAMEQEKKQEPGSTEQPQP